jgi:glycyl-tRNA synthetase
MKTITFQELIQRLQAFWASRGCLLWRPYSEKVGAGTMNPATVLGVLGPRAWNVAYAEPSYRPDDGRYGENPNRLQMHTQYQVILKPDPGNTQELYLESLEALGVSIKRHDIRFVEDNWESPALGAWGLGWEVWLDGLEITQFTYFQQAAGQVLQIPAVEITYGLERIAMFLQGVRSVWDLDWNGSLKYRDVLLRSEIDYCRYDFEIADVGRLQLAYQLFEEEARSCIAAGVVVPAFDYVLRCSHTFNILDARGAVGVTERASYFARMRDLTRQVAGLYLKQFEENEPLPPEAPPASPTLVAPLAVDPLPEPADFVLEVGTEELPADDVAAAVAQWTEAVPALLKRLRLSHEGSKLRGARGGCPHTYDVWPRGKRIWSSRSRDRPSSAPTTLRESRPPPPSASPRAWVSTSTRCAWSPRARKPRSLAARRNSVTRPASCSPPRCPTSSPASASARLCAGKRPAFLSAAPSAG